ncbi:MAG: hypothetical protein VKJ86_07870 [Synechococcus sp.]|nr:hypothetical protein [Synechococcus sp.]
MGQDPTLGWQNMNAQSYIHELKHQLDLLYLLVEQLQQGLSPDRPLRPTDTIQMPPAIDPAVFSLDLRIGGESCQHQDVMLDPSMGLEGHPMNAQEMSPELQVKRLTAQLTVAYKRIAQLEEQLLSRQNEHNGSQYIYSS